MLRSDVAKTAGDHNRLVVAPDALGRGGLKATKIAGQIWASELIVERGGANRALDHDLQRRDDAVGAPVVQFPGAGLTGNLQMGHRKSNQSGLGTGAATHGPLIADFAAGTGAGSGKR